MPAHLWELRADVRPLDDAADRWSELGQLMAQRADELVRAARVALDGWDAAAADSYDEHRRQVVANLDLFTTLTGKVATSLRALSGVITTTQEELDRAWLNVSLVPHQVVGHDRQLVFAEASDEDRGTVARCQLEAEEIRRRLAGALEQESSRLHGVRAELVLVRASLVDLAGGGFASFLGRSELGADGVSTSVRGSAESGVGVGVGLAPIGSISVSMPHLSGMPAPGPAPVIGVTAGGLAERRATSSGGASGGGMPPVGGGMAAGAVRGASSLRGGQAGRRTGGGSGMPVTPRQGAEDRAPRENKRAELAERHSARAARKAERADERRDQTGSAVAEVAPDDRPGSPRL